MPKDWNQTLSRIQITIDPPLTHLGTCDHVTSQTMHKVLDLVTEDWQFIVRHMSEITKPTTDWILTEHLQIKNGVCLLGLQTSHPKPEAMSTSRDNFVLFQADPTKFQCLIIAAGKVMTMIVDQKGPFFTDHLKQGWINTGEYCTELAEICVRWVEGEKLGKSWVRTSAVTRILPQASVADSFMMQAPVSSNPH